MKKLFATVAFSAIVLASGAASATTVTLNLVASYSRSDAFGLAYDGSHVWWSDGGGSIHEMTTGGIDTGNVITGTQWSALAWDASKTKIATVTRNGITEYDRATTGSVSSSSLNAVHTDLAGSPNFLTDGLDIEGQTVYWSPDVSFVNKSNLDGSGSTTQILPAGGGYSGVEFVNIGAANYLFVVNDATSPRQLCYHDAATAAQLGCTTLPNNRYEDLAFDGRYLYAADFYGSRIDKIDVLSDGVSVFDPGPAGVPEPASWALMIIGFFSVGSLLRRQEGLAAPVL